MPILIEAKLIACIVLFVILMGLVIALRTEREKVQSLTAQLHAVAADNHQDQTVIEGMKTALSKWQDTVIQSAAAQKAAESDLAEARAQAASTQDKAQKLAGADHARPKCAETLAIDLGDVCPGNVAALRMRSAISDLQRPLGTSPRARVRGAAG